MVLIGKANWWMPRWLEPIVPRLSIEGAEFFKERDGVATPRRSRSRFRPTCRNYA
jgi:putative drug exporter of the RND superfamily